MKSIAAKFREGISLTQEEKVQFVAAREFPDISGILLKRKDSSKGSTGHWSKRWAIIQANRLFYCINQNSEYPVGYLYLQGCTVSLADKGHGKYTYGFDILAKHSKTNHSTWTDHVHHFAVEDEETRSKWIEAIKSASLIEDHSPEAQIDKLVEKVPKERKRGKTISAPTNDHVPFQDSHDHIDPIISLLEVEVVEAKDIPKMDTRLQGGKADPYCIINFSKQFTYKTPAKRNTLSPVWNSIVKIPMRESERNFDLEIVVKDKDISSRDDFIGSTVIELQPLIEETEKELGGWLELHNPDMPSLKATIHVQVRLKDKKVVEEEFWKHLAKDFDLDETNSIDYAQFLALLQAINSPASDHEASKLFLRTDLNNDGRIQLEEFLQLIEETKKKEDPIFQRLLPHEDFIWYWSSKLLENENLANKVLMSGFQGGTSGKIIRKKEKSVDLVEAEEVLVYDRKTNKLIKEKIPEYIKVALRLMYATGSVKQTLDWRAVVNSLQQLTFAQGKKYSDPKSKEEILPFIQYHNLDVDEFLDPVESFKTFNEFFYRKLKPGARLLASEDPNVVVSPADCRCTVFHSLTEATKFWIKGKNFTLETFLRDEKLAEEFNGGSLLISRLAPQDYHRFHVPVNCTFEEMKILPGGYYTVNPIAVNQSVDVFTENKRTLCILNSPEFGKVLYIAIGATMVGSIIITKKPKETLSKGDEMGYFAFGGSTVITLFKKDTIKFDKDLVINSTNKTETRIFMGGSVGTRVLQAIALFVCLMSV